MSRLKVWGTLVFMLVLVIATSFKQVSADQEALEDDYSVVTSNNEFVFVMFIPDEEIEFRIEALNDTSNLPANIRDKYPSPNYKSILDFLQREGLGTDKKLRTKYPCSGLYRNDGSDTPIWTVNWYALRVFVHPDGEHLIRNGRWPRFNDYNELAVAFYRNGNELEKYTVQDLVANPELLPRSVSHYEWREDVAFDEKSGILHIETKTSEIYDFNVFEMSPEKSNKVTSCRPNDLYIYTHEPERKPLFLLIAVSISLVGIFLLALKIIKAKRGKNIGYSENAPNKACT